MSKTWAWVASAIVGLCVVGLIIGGRSERRSYWGAKGLVLRNVDVTPGPMDRLMARSPGR